MSFARRIAAAWSLIAAVVVAVAIPLAAPTPSGDHRMHAAGALTTPDRATPAPVDGVTPATVSRVVDLAASARTRARWGGELLATLAALAGCGAVAVTLLCRRTRETAPVAPRRRPATERAPPFGSLAI